ncbi:MAG TPA: DUF1854 domain-containing protein [Fimbriimonadaceae bacterium]|nr:DUF1854 domain-containing protein [Fimbriimonadaceae bacterium]
MKFRLFYHPEGRLRMETEDRCWLQVRPVWASPVTQPGKYLSLLDGKDKEIVMFENGLDDVGAENRTILHEELRHRYLTSQVTRIEHAHFEFGSTYWTVETDRGPKDFVTQSLQENAQWHGPAHLVLVDVDGNRFEIRDFRKLDEQSQRILAKIV